MNTEELTHYQWETGPMFEQWEKPTDLSPEQRLWRVVILTFLQDIQKDYLEYVNSLNGKRGSLYNKLNVHFKIAHSDWLIDVCGFAGLPNDKFRNVVDDIICGRIRIKLPKKFHS